MQIKYLKLYYPAVKNKDRTFLEAIVYSNLCFCPTPDLENAKDMHVTGFSSILGEWVCRQTEADYGKTDEGKAWWLLEGRDKN